MSVAPITPKEAKDLHSETVVPDFVIAIVNQLLVEKYESGDIQILQRDIVERIMDAEPGITSQQIFERRYLDFEAIYKKAGWSVTYDKPAYNESYDAYFLFKKKS